MFNVQNVVDFLKAAPAQFIAGAAAMLFAGIILRLLRGTPRALTPPATDTTPPPAITDASAASVVADPVLGPLPPPTELERAKGALLELLELLGAIQGRPATHATEVAGWWQPAQLAAQDLAQRSRYLDAALQLQHVGDRDDGYALAHLCKEMYYGGQVVHAALRTAYNDLMDNYPGESLRAGSYLGRLQVILRLLPRDQERAQRFVQAISDTAASGA